jgi:general secretion pathway protein A
MYKEFFGLSRNPFEISPDPYFLFTTERHNEALASIVHGVLRQKGFIVVTGEAGTGKTLLLRCLLEYLRRQGTVSANVFNPCLTPLEFLRYIAGDLGLKAPNQDKGTLLLELNSFLIARHRRRLTTVLIVDEAQLLEPELLEEIRLLTNLETSQQKLLQIVLAGQPELDQKLDSPQLRQLKQRVALRCQLEPLQEKDIAGYVVRRLLRAGASSHAGTIFPPPALAAIYYYSRGIPRLINTICENALIAAYSEKSHQVSCDIIYEVANDLRLDVVTPVSAQPVITGGQRHMAKSLIELVEVLEQVARGVQLSTAAPSNGVKIV